MGELVDPADLKSAALCVPVRLRLLVPEFCLGSLMVKQATHNRLSGSSILSLGTNNKGRYDSTIYVRRCNQYDW